MGDITVRAAEDADDEAVVDLLVAVMKRDPRDPNREFYRWKHRENPFGRSPSWVAECDGKVVAFRTLMRWRFERGGAPLTAVRAVDTVTHPDHRGQGLFRRLTTTALAELREEGVDLVFNTPNSSSMPGYLSMGWVEVGRLPARLHLGPVTSWSRVARARTPARVWSEPVDAGERVADVPLAALLAEEGHDRSGRSTGDELTTPRCESFLRWRYGFEPLHYRCWLSPDDRAAVVFRVRRRGPARELAVLDVVGRRQSVRARHVRALVRATRTDHAVSIGRAGGARGLPAGRVGPVLTAREVVSTPPREVSGWNLSLGDVELF